MTTSAMAGVTSPGRVRRGERSPGPLARYCCLANRFAVTTPCTSKLITEEAPARRAMIITTAAARAAIANKMPKAAENASAASPMPLKIGSKPWAMSMIPFLLNQRPASFYMRRGDVTARGGARSNTIEPTAGNCGV